MYFRDSSCYICRVKRNFLLLVFLFLVVVVILMGYLVFSAPEIVVPEGVKRTLTEMVGVEM